MRDDEGQRSRRRQLLEAPILSCLGREPLELSPRGRRVGWEAEIGQEGDGGPHLRREEARAEERLRA